MHLCVCDVKFLDIVTGQLHAVFLCMYNILYNSNKQMISVESICICQFINPAILPWSQHVTTCVFDEHGCVNANYILINICANARSWLCVCVCVCVCFCLLATLIRAWCGSSNNNNKSNRNNTNGHNRDAAVADPSRRPNCFRVLLPELFYKFVPVAAAAADKQRIASNKQLIATNGN